MKIALICGGPSLERGISLNSARSVMDHLGGEGMEIVPIYFDQKRRAYHIDTGQLYSNTPSDFDFKLQQTAKYLSKTALKQLLKSVDLAFPVMHGQFGEDGTIQRLLERYGVPYMGADALACRRCFDKYEANEFIRAHGFFALPSAVLKIYHNDHEKIIREFFKAHNLSRAIVKPATGGSSIGVFSVGTPEEALEKSKILFSKRMDTRVVIEPFCEGIEFTVILLQNRFGMPVAVLPTEIEADYQAHQIFDFRKKYLPTRQVTYHCPPRFDHETIERIQVQAEQLFTILGMRDFARFDGWLLPDGNIWFSDFNPISGMEQNSFLFQQSARLGMSHRDLLHYLVKNACRRYGQPLPKQKTTAAKAKKPVHVLFGGSTSERQVSLMSGTNAWLKLRRSQQYDAKPFLLDLHENVWEIPYSMALNHTVEEIYENCLNASTDEKRLHYLVDKVKLRLALEPGEASEPFFLPRRMALETFLDESKGKFVFIGLHGGIGEDGRLQTALAKRRIPFNGPNAEASQICMDKARTGELLAGLESKGIYSAPKQSFPLKKLSRLKLAEVKRLWSKLQRELDSKTLIIKPQSDGCSSGVVRLFNPEDLARYIELASMGVASIAAGTFQNQNGILEMPQNTMTDVLFERFIETDPIRVRGNRLKWRKKTGWIEVTVGILEEKGKIRALSPSLTVAEGEVLTVEEKFQGGTGINITPPSEEIVAPQILERAKRSIELVAQKLGLSGYSRVDTFLQVDTGDIIVIEVNTTPALTPSTVLFHQALVEKPAILPGAFLEKLIENKGY